MVVLRWGTGVAVRIRACGIVRERAAPRRRPAAHEARAVVGGSAARTAPGILEGRGGRGSGGEQAERRTATAADPRGEQGDEARRAHV
ncbi:hypothetical protein, partial [Clavibacter tessellarius]|uniref:hypothetical protein n=1 Tax=Clavibacter tessellarius TaxID=31965 RepID=UPI001C309224